MAHEPVIIVNLEKSEKLKKKKRNTVKEGSRSHSAGGCGIPLTTEWPRGRLPFPCLLNLFACTTYMPGAGGGQTLGRLDWS